MKEAYDLILLGAGLTNLWIAFRLRERFPQLRVVLLERDSGFAGRQTWCFQESDVPAGVLAALAPFIGYRWDGYRVAFPGGRRRLASPYACIPSAPFFAKMRGILGDSIVFGQEVVEVGDGVVRTRDREWHGRVIFDGRGFAPARANVSRGYQCFLGQELELDTPHGLTEPTVMDASVAQFDGFRFLYVLPFGERSLLVEDTRYTEYPPTQWSGQWDRYREGVREYAHEKGWRVSRVTREESGVLPIPLWADDMGVDENDPTCVAVGVRGGWFNPTTGYSLPDAVRVVQHLEEVGIGKHTVASLRAFRHTRARKPYCLLNRMLYLGTPAPQRFRLLERFYDFPEKLIARFYRSELTAGDWMRLLFAGRPPIPVGVAARCVWARPGEAAGWQHAWA